MLGGSAAISIHVADPARRSAYLAYVEGVVLDEVAHGRWVQDDSCPTALQRGLRAFVHLDVASDVAQNQRSGQSAQGPSHHHDTQSRMKAAATLPPDNVLKNPHSDSLYLGFTFSAFPISYIRSLHVQLCQRGKRNVKLLEEHVRLVVPSQAPIWVERPHEGPLCYFPVVA